MWGTTNRHTPSAIRAWVGWVYVFWIALALGQNPTSPLQPQLARVGNLQVSYVRAPLSSYRLEVALAGNRVVNTNELANIAKRSGAVCAINGTFLAAYTGQTQEPYGTVAQKGKVLHIGSVGTRLDVLSDGQIRLVQEGLRILGGIDGVTTPPNNWYAYNLNRTPTPNSNYAYIFTPERGPNLGFAATMSVVVVEGVVRSIVRGQNVAIPPNGWVLGLGGREVDILGKKFKPGQSLAYRVVDKQNNPLEVAFSLGAGPRLLSGGAISVNAVAEGFKEDKILQMRTVRSAVGVTAKGEVILATFPSATLTEAAKAMQSLGATEAMNLDGGASSGLYCSGQYVSRPGRPIANALILRPR